MKRIAVGASLIALILVGLILSIGYRVKADNAYHALSPTTPLAQDWSNIALLDTAGVWSGVPSINGYNDNVADAIGADPQNTLVPFTTLNVSPNKNDPAAFSTGGVAEFDRVPTTNFVVALQGVSNSDFPNIDIQLNTSSCVAPTNSVKIDYNVRDIDGSPDNAIQQVALQYRVGSVGNYTNIAAGYIADATTGPNLATLVTPISVNLPAAAQGQSQVHVRIMTSNAINNDEWVGIDDINIRCQAATAADVSVSGRTTDRNGRGVRNIRVVVSGGALTEPRTALTGPFGYFRIDGLRAGQTYILTVSGKRYIFQNPSRVVSLGDDLADVDFTGEPR